MSSPVTPRCRKLPWGGFQGLPTHVDTPALGGCLRTPLPPPPIAPHRAHPLPPAVPTNPAGPEALRARSFPALI